jgi:hypothetical protein
VKYGDYQRLGIADLFHRLPLHGDVIQNITVQSSITLCARKTRKIGAKFMYQQHGWTAISDNKRTTMKDDLVDTSRKRAEL